jgi:hypothetical protein
MNERCTELNKRRTKNSLVDKHCSTSLISTLILIPTLVGLVDFERYFKIFISLKRPCLTKRSPFTNKINLRDFIIKSKFYCREQQTRNNRPPLE